MRAASLCPAPTVSDASLAGIVTFYSLIHLERGAAGGVLTELTVS